MKSAWRLLLLPPLLLWGAAADDIQAARLWATAEKTRLVLESDAPLAYSVSGLESPPRLVVDIKANITTAADNLGDIAEASRYIKTVRNSRLTADTWRIVFDLTAAVDYRVSRLQPIARYRHRLVFDIQPQEASDPLFALIKQLRALDDPFVVLIDPGHGGEDPGAVSPRRNYEKNIVLHLSKLLAEDINRRPGMRAILTRGDDRFIPLYERVHQAHRLNSDAFVSVHADSVQSPKARGSSVFILSKKGASTPFSKQLAEQANLSDLIGGALPQTADAALELALREFSKDGKDRASRLLAEMMLEKISEVNDLHSKRIESAGFAVLKSPSIPSILVETAFISNPTEEKKLLNADFQRKLVAAMAGALQQYKDIYHTGQ